MKKLFLCAMVLSLFFSCEKDINVYIEKGPGTIIGQVMPVGINAFVELRKLDQTVHVDVDADGYFTITELEPGHYTLLIDAADYGRKELSRIYVGDDEIYDVGTIELSKIPYPIQSVSIWDGASRVTTDRIYIRFSESMNWETLKGAVHVEPDDSEMHLSFSGDRNMTIYLDLIMGTEYTVTIDTNACTIGGKPLEFNYSFSFTTEPFRLEYFGSVYGSRSKDFNPLYFNFNADVDPDVFMENLAINPPVEVSAEGTSYEDRVLLYPLHGWVSGTNMTFTISADFTDINGNHLPGDTTLSVEIDPLEITSVSPYDKQYFVSLAPVIIIYFNNLIDESTIAGALKITPEINPNIVTYRSSEYSMLRVYPDSSLASNTLYTIEIDTSLTDYYDINLPEKFVSVFTTK